MTTRLVRRVALWLLATMAAVVLHGTALQLADAWLDRDDAASLLAVCTAQGVRWVDMDQAAADTGDDHRLADGDSDHCPLCRVVAEAALHLERIDLSYAPPSPIAHRVPRILGPDLAEPPSWLLEPPRGPPAQA